MKQRISPLNPPGVAAPIRSYYSNAYRVEAGPLLFIAGQVPIDVNGNLVGDGDAGAQAEQVFANIEAILNGAGGSLSDLVKVLVFVTDFADLPQITAVRARLFPKDGPASSVIEVKALINPRMKVEIEAVAAIGASGA